jgi:hypothetical protein
MNAKEELKKSLESAKQRIKCAYIYFGIEDDNDMICPRIELPTFFTESDLIAFWEKLDLEYDNGYGGQYLFGTVWLEKPGHWLERGEYDGSEWWEHKFLPEIPESLKPRLQVDPNRTISLFNNY